MSRHKKLFILISIIASVIIVTFLISLIGYNLINKNVESIEDNNNKQAVISQIHNQALKQQLEQYAIIITGNPEEKTEIIRTNQELNRVISEYQSNHNLSQREQDYLNSINRDSKELLKNFEEKILPEIEKSKSKELKNNLITIAKNMGDIYQREIQLRSNIYSSVDKQVSDITNYIGQINASLSESKLKFADLKPLTDYYSSGVERLKTLNLENESDREEIATIVSSLGGYITQIQSIAANTENSIYTSDGELKQPDTVKLSAQIKMLGDINHLIEWTGRMYYSMLEAAFVGDADFTAYNNASSRVGNYIASLSQSLAGNDKNVISTINTLNQDNVDMAKLVINETSRSKNSAILNNVNYSISLLSQIDKASSELSETLKQYINEGINKSRRLQASIIVILSVIILVSISIGMLLAISIRNTVLHIRRMTKMIDRAERGELNTNTAFIDNEVLGELAVKVRSMIDRNKKVADDVLSAEKDIDFLKRNLALISNESKEKMSNISKGYYSTVNTIKGSMRNLKEPTKDVSKLVEGVQNMSHVTQKVIGDSMRAMEIAASSGKIIAEVEHTVKKVTESISNVTGTISDLEKSSRQIVQLTDEISDVAARADILTTNATIEAQKPSFSSRDYIIVIDEMGKIVKHSNKLIKDVKGLVKQTQSHVYSLIDGMSSGVYGVGESIGKINAVKAYIGDVVVSMKMIVDAMRETADEVREYVASTSYVANVIGTFNKSVQESTADSEHVRKNIEEQAMIIKEMETLSRMLENTSNKLETVTEGYKVYSSYMKQSAEGKMEG